MLFRLEFLGATMLRVFGYTLLFSCVILIAASNAEQEPARIALLIGNQNYYEKVGKLKNPHNDVALVGNSLKKLGFKVTILEDTDYRDMDIALKKFADEIQSQGNGAISLFYYSGHGAANPKNKTNYLIPVDVSDPTDANIWYKSIQQNDIIDKLSKQAPNATHYVIFDACRNELNLSVPVGKAIGAEKGFVPIATTAGLLIAYATAPGKTASDIGNDGGPYARALAEEILKPLVEAVEMFRKVQLRVRQAIDQDPWLSFPSLPEFYFGGRPHVEDANTNEGATYTVSRSPITFSGLSEPITSVAFSPDGKRVITGSQDRTIKLWDVTAGRLVNTINATQGVVNYVAFSPDGRLLSSAGQDKSLRLWERSSGLEIRAFDGHEGEVTSVAFSPDGRGLLSASKDKTLKFWDIASGRLLRTFRAHSGPVTAVVFSPDGRLALSGSVDGTAKLWDIASGLLVRSFEGQDGGITSVAFSPDKRLVFTGSQDKSIKSWDAATGDNIRTFSGHRGEVTSVAASPDGELLLSGSVDKTLRLWDVATSKLVRVVGVHSGPINSVAYSPDGIHAISGSSDITVRLWNVTKGKELVQLAASPSGDWFAMTSSGFFAASRRDLEMLAISRGFEVTSIGQVYQSFYNPDLVREALSDDPDGEVNHASEVINLDKLLDSGPPPAIEILPSPAGNKQDTDLVKLTALIRDRGKGIGRIEWRVNGVTVGVCHAPSCLRPNNEVTWELALEPGENTIEVVAYNARDLLASLPAQTTITYTGLADTIKPKLHVLAIGINEYEDRFNPSDPSIRGFGMLHLAVYDAVDIGDAFKKAGAGLYSEVNVETVLDDEATIPNLEAVIDRMAAKIHPRDTFVFFAAAHGYSHEGRFYLIPQDYHGGTDPEALKARAIDQTRLQDWIANRIKAKKAIILLDTSESGALTSGYLRSRSNEAASDASMGRLHEATGRPVLTAAAQGEGALEFPNSQNFRHGLFTGALLDALHHAETNPKGEIMLSALVAHVQNLVPQLVKDKDKREAVLIREGPPGDEQSVGFGSRVEQSVRFGSRGEDFPLVRRLQ